MTSKSLFFKRFKQDFEQRIWLPVIFFLVGFVCLEFPLISGLDRYRRNTNVTPERITEYLMDDFFSPGSFFFWVSIAIAVIGAMSGYAYMHSAKKLDVYHSIPIKRRSLFIQQYVYGLVYYLVPTLLHVLICLGICKAKNALEPVVVIQALWFLLTQFLMFWMMYSIVIFAVCLTGNNVITLLMTALLSFLSMIVALLRSALMQSFFVTYYETEIFWNFPAFSPGHLLCKLFYNMLDGYGDFYAYASQVDMYVKMAVLALVYSGIALWLYGRRPTEAAGKTMAFPITEPIVKTIVVIPISIATGYLFEALFTYNNMYGWFMFGCAFGFVISCPLMEAIFCKDIKALFRRPLQIVFNAVFLVVLVMVFRMDLFNYDSYLPKESEVESYAISLNCRDAVYAPGEYFHTLNDMEIRGNESARKLIEKGVEITRPVRSMNGNRIVGDAYYTSMIVKYRLKNGKEVCRNYILDLNNEETLKLLEDTVNDPQYKKGIYPVLNEDLGVRYGGAILEYITGEETIPLSEEQMQKFLATYREELLAVTFEEMTTQEPVALMELALQEENEGYVDPEVTMMETVQIADAKYSAELIYYGTEGAYRIYPSCEKTLALLEEYGANIMVQIPVEYVTRLEVEENNPWGYDDNGVEAEWQEPVTVEYTMENGDEFKIAEIIPTLSDYRFVPEYAADEGQIPSVNVYITISRDGYEREEYFRMKQGMMPEFVTEDLKKAAQ